jgi:hypothetical protein
MMCNPKPALVPKPITLTLLYNLAAILQSLNKYIVYHHFMCPKKVSEGQAKKIDNQLLKLFITDYQPFSIVEDKGFVEFVKALNPSYQLPGRKAISKNMIPALHERCLNTVQEKMDSIKSVCITTDCWTSRNVNSYLAVTAHYITEDCSLNSVLIGCSLITGSHTSENLAENIKT